MVNVDKCTSLVHFVGTLFLPLYAPKSALSQAATGPSAEAALEVVCAFISLAPIQAAVIPSLNKMSSQGILSIYTVTLTASLHVFQYQMCPCDCSLFKKEIDVTEALLDH